MDFPQYRKLSNGKAFYKIESDRFMTEVQLIGSKPYIHEVRAEKYPEMMRIADILANDDGNYLTSSEEEFNSLLRK